jgi:hypothetical protein
MPVSPWAAGYARCGRRCGPRQVNTLFQRILAIAYEKAVRRAWVKSVFLAGRCVDLRCARIGGSDRFVVDRLRGLGVAYFQRKQSRVLFIGSVG